MKESAMLLSWLRRHVSPAPKTSRRRVPRRRPVPLGCECLDERCLPSVFTVAAGSINVGGSTANDVGIAVEAASNTVGGTTSAARNLISGNGTGVLVATGSGNVVEGNFLGTDVTGTLPLGGGSSAGFALGV